jgi:very-short-patch-repair endonuclease
MRDKLTQVRARKLRNQSTDAERLLWQGLRRQQLGGYRFRRQVAIAGDIADFVCIEAKLIVELDGGQHQEQVAYDARRDARLIAEGYRVLRFWNNQVFEETTAVLETILRELLLLRPHPDLLLRYKCALAPRAGEGT